MDRSTSEGGYDVRVVRYMIGAGAPRADLDAALAVYEAGCRPAPPRQLSALLGRLRAMTVSRAGDQTDLELTIRVYTDELAKFPADAAVRVLTDWPQSNKFWPAWAELQSELDALVRIRVLMLAALRGAA